MKKIVFWALFILVLIILTSCANQGEEIQERYIPSGEVMNSYEVDFNSSYAAPANGTGFYFDEVVEALKENAGQDIIYFLAIDIMSDGTQLDVKSEEMTTELKRLANYGYHVGYAEAWTYEGGAEEQKQVDYTYIAGYFTEDNLLNFSPSENYGYSFRFAKNGDSSPVSAEQGIVTSF